MIADLPTRPLGVDPDGEVRLSLAGTQDKLPVFVDPGGRVGLPRGGAPSSHIVKAPLPQRDSVVNEAVCLALATELGITAASAEPRTIAGREFLLVGNMDAHAKNFSLLLDSEGPRLAPLYDILCTRCYTGLSRKMAMTIGGRDKADWVEDRHWDRFAGEAGLGAVPLRRRRRALAARASPALERVVERLDSAGWRRPILDKVASEVARWARRLAA